MYNNDLVLTIKRIIYNMYDRKVVNIAAISSEVTIRIPNTKVQGISKDHNGITLSFLCDSDMVTKQDIENITMNIMYDFIQHSIINRLSPEEINEINEEVIYNLFNVMYCRGRSFSIVI